MGLPALSVQMVSSPTGDMKQEDVQAGKVFLQGIFLQAGNATLYRKGGRGSFVLKSTHYEKNSQAEPPHI